MPSIVDIGTGATVTFAASTAFIPNYTNISWGSIARPAIKTSHLGTTAMDTFVPGDLTDPGEATFSMQWDLHMTPPYTGTGSSANTVTVKGPVPSGFSVAASWAAQGFITGISNEIPLEDLMTAEVTVKFSGTITISSATT